MRQTFTGLLMSQSHDDNTMDQLRAIGGLQIIKGANRPGLGKSVLHLNSNSGAQALNLAYLRGATDIIMLGYDMGHADGRSHWFGDHPKELRNSNYQSYIPNFTRLARDLDQAGVSVVNCSRATYLDQFTRATLEVTLGRYHHAA